jgi:phosphoribosylanthranilate isomerase
MSLFVKICGITELAAAEAAVEAGADAVGFVFASSPRQIDPRGAVQIAGELPPATLRVAVFRRPKPGEIETVLEVFTPDLVQADYESLEGFTATGTLPVYREGDLVDPDGGPFLFEGPMSGVGRTVDMSLAAGVARRGDMVLAGGLRPDNVANAIEEVGPYGVDVSSGVEVSPGVKDPALIRSFVAAVRAAEERAVSA